MTRAKAGAAAITATLLTGALHAAGSGLSYFTAREGISTDNEVADGLVVRRFGEFSWPLGRGGSDLWPPFLVGLAVTVVVVLVLVLALVRSLASGSGGLSAFLGTWFAVLLATVIGKAAWTVVATETVMNGRTFPGWWTTNIQSGAWWGLIFGWLAAAGATIAYVIANRGHQKWGYAREEQQLGAPAVAPSSTWVDQPQQGFTSATPAHAQTTEAQPSLSDKPSSPEDRA